MSHPRRNMNWLLGSILCIVAAGANVIFYSQTGKMLLGRRSLGSRPSIDVVMSVLLLVFGVIALFIHFSKGRQ